MEGDEQLAAGQVASLVAALEGDVAAGLLRRARLAATCAAVAEQVIEEVIDCDLDDDEIEEVIDWDPSADRVLDFDKTMADLALLEHRIVAPPGPAPRWLARGPQAPVEVRDEPSPEPTSGLGKTETDRDELATVHDATLEAAAAATVGLGDVQEVTEGWSDAEQEPASATTERDGPVERVGDGELGKQEDGRTEGSVEQANGGFELQAAQTALALDVQDLPTGTGAEETQAASGASDEEREADEVEQIVTDEELIFPAQALHSHGDPRGASQPLEA